MTTRFHAALAAGLLAAAVAGAAAEQARREKCPVSGGTVDVSAKTPKVQVNGRPRYFCCDRCPQAFAKSPEKYLKEVGPCPIIGGQVEQPEPALRTVVNNSLWYVCCPGCSDGVPSSTLVRKGLEDVVSRAKFDATAASPSVVHAGQLYLFSSPATKAAFEKTPEKYAVIYGK